VSDSDLGVFLGVRIYAAYETTTGNAGYMNSSIPPLGIEFRSRKILSRLEVRASA
jgi:hypothetical protein